MRYKKVKEQLEFCNILMNRLMKDFKCTGYKERLELHSDSIANKTRMMEDSKRIRRELNTFQIMISQLWQL